MELKRQMQAFEEYALAEILKVPAGLMADVPPSSSSAAAAGGGATEEEVSPQEESAVEEQLQSLRQQIAASKRRARDMHAACAELDQLMAGAQQRMTTLAAVPAALAAGGGRENLTVDAKAIVDKGAAVEAGCIALDRNRTKMVDGGAVTLLNGDVVVLGGSGEAAAAADDLTDASVEREILRRQGAVKSAPAEDLKAMRETLGVGGGDATSS